MAAASLVWTNQEFGTHFMTAIPKDGYLYGVDGHGPRDAYLVCVELEGRQGSVARATDCGRRQLTTENANAT